MEDVSQRAHDHVDSCNRAYHDKGAFTELDIIVISVIHNDSKQF